MLVVTDHSRDAAGLLYVYPVVSRRAGGVSVGINLNPNNACNWACVYCQVPDLVRGGPPPIDLARLERELRGFLREATTGDYLVRHAPPEARRLVDVAFSGNGEPTSAPEFPAAVELVGRILDEYALAQQMKLRVITNGSLMHRVSVRRGLASVGALDGEVWFKIDRATQAGMAAVNGIRRTPVQLLRALLTCAELAPTWVQTCYFMIDGEEASAEEQAAYLELIEAAAKKIKGVHLYGMARPSLQPDAGRLANVSPDRLRQFALRIAAVGVEVAVSP